MRTALRTVTTVMTLAAVVAGGAKFASAAKTPEAEALDFYKGKIVNFIVPYDTGGGYDIMARLVAPYIQKYLPGSTVVIDNVPGAGGMIGMDKLYSARKDGLTIGIVNTVGVISAHVTGNKAARFDLKQFNWLGRIDAEPNMLVMGPNTPYKTFNDLVKSQKTIKLSSTGAGTSQNSCEKVLSDAAKLNTQIITGYNGSNDTNMAVVRGEVDGAMPPPSSAYTLIHNTKGVPILVMSLKRVTEYPNVPTAAELISGPGKKMVESMSALMDAGRSVATTPGIPEERLALLKQALDKALHDPALIAEATKAKRPLGYLDAADLRKLVERSMVLPENVKSSLK